jgi:hypothetical protein
VKNPNGNMRYGSCLCGITRGIGRTYSYKELKIMQFLKQNKTKREMAGVLDISEATVSAIIDKIKKGAFD